MDIEKTMKEVLADIDKYDAEQFLLVAGMKKGAQELYDRLTGRKGNQPTAASTEGRKEKGPQAGVAGGQVTGTRNRSR